MNLVSAFDYRSAGDAPAPEIVFGKFSGEKTFLKADADFEKGRLPTVFPMMPPVSPEEPFYYSLTEPGDNEYSLAVFFRGRKYPVVCGREPRGEFTLAGLEEELRPIQANIFRMSEHCFRMYFWAHFHGTPRKVRMLTAESSDNCHWKIVNGGRPVFCHYSDILSREGKFPVSRQCNDATAIYRRSDGGFEVFSASLVTLDAASGTRYCRKDIWRGYVRVIQRWVGDGAENWSDPEIVAIPDAEDPADLQMYYLCVNALPHGNFGWLGRYSAATQSMGMEPVWSFDRRHWLRPCRASLGPNRDSVITVPAHHMAEDGDKFLLYYTCANYDHNFQTAGNAERTVEIRVASIDRFRLFGRELRSEAILTPPLRLTEPELELFTSPDAELSFVWRNAFGETSGKKLECVRVAPGRWLCRPSCPAGAAGMLEIRGRGQVFDLRY